MAVTASYIQSTDFDSFDPNAMSKADELWALYDGYKFRTFSTRSPAIQALHAATEAKLYFMGRTEWELVVVKKHSPDKRCDNCGEKPDGWYGRPWMFERVNGRIPPGTNITLMYLCQSCKGFYG